MSFRNKVKQACNKAAIRIAMRRPAPNRIPLSGEERLRARNYFVVYLGDHSDQNRFVTQSVEAQGVSGLWFDEQQEPREASIPDSLLHQYRVRITFYFRDLEIRYSSALEFVIHQFAGVPHIQYIRERLARFFFNRRTLIRGDRMAVTRLVLEQTLANHQFQTDAMGLMTLLYGPRWVHHPDDDRLLQYYEFLLDSLTESGDLIRESNLYRLAPRAISTLAQFEEDNRRHRDLVRQQAVLGFLTAALVVIGFLQILADFFGFRQ